MKRISTVALSLLGAGTLAVALAVGALFPRAVSAQDATAAATMDMSGMAMATQEMTAGCPSSTFALLLVARNSGFTAPFDLSGYNLGQFTSALGNSGMNGMATAEATMAMSAEMTPMATESMAMLSSAQCSQLLTSVTQFLDTQSSANGTATAEATASATQGANAGSMAPVAFVARMSGPQEVPTADPDAVGTAFIVIRPDVNQVCWTYNVAGMDLPASAAHIHKGEVGVSGPVVVPLTPADASGAANGCTTAAADVVQAILSNPSGYYVNVHNAAFPNGALRGNLLGM